MKLSRLALVGARGHHEKVLRSLERMPTIRLVGLCEGNAGPIDTISEWCLRHGHSPHVANSYHELLEKNQPQAVVICGPFERHADMAIDAIRRGIHVLVEKPAALTLDDLSHLHAVHQTRPDVRLAQMHTGRFQVGMHTAKQLIASGAIGDVRLLNARKSYKLGPRDAYYHERSTYGGTIPWVGIHAIDWVLWLSGHHVRSVYANHSAACNNGNGTMERSALCQFTLCGERMASVSIDIFRPSRALTHGDDWVRVVGTEGVIEAQPERVCLINADRDGSEVVPLSNPKTMFEDFGEYVEGGTAINTADDLFSTTTACLLARQSADEKRAIDFATNNVPSITAVEYAHTRPFASTSLNGVLRV